MARVAGIRPGHLYQDLASGKRDDRPELTRLLDQLRPGDVMMVWKLDRLSHSLKDLLHLLERIEAVGASLRSLTKAVDTVRPAESAQQPVQTPTL